MISDPPDNRLKIIQSLTDTTLSHLAERDLLDELMSRVKKALGADTSSVLLREGRSGYLIPAAASGLVGDIGAGARIPVGQGFAGRIASERRAMTLDHVDVTSVLDPELIAAGIRSLLGVPLINGGQVLGVLHVGSFSERAFTGEDSELLQLAADRASAAVQSLMTRDDQRAAAALQRSLLPTALPQVPGIEMAASYLPGTGMVGGDWYDVFVLPSGEIGLVIGDVAGSGLAAAVVMGRMRSALRAYALQTSDPAKVLRQMDRKIQYFESGSLATVLYAVVNAERTAVRISSAGHMPPVYAPPDGPAVVVATAQDLLIGLDIGAERRSVRVDLVPGSVLCCYTDGLVERRDEVIDDGIERLRASVIAGPAEALNASVLHELAFNHPQDDDTALVTLRRLGTVV
jgi:serine phosphatase RsbU (regulator of sigma subunit)